MAEPRKITIKLRPVGAKPAGAPKPAAAVAEEPAAVPVQAPAEAMTEVPAAAATVADAATAPVTETGASPAQQAKRQTSRIELPPELTQQPMNAAGDATIRLKPISQSAAPADPDATQATKSKTARIALDSVLGGIQSNTPIANTTQKTIKLKRSTPTTVAKPSASEPMMPVTEGAGEEKTIKLRRPASLGLKKDAPKPEVEPELESLEPLDDEMGLAPLETPVATAEETTGAKVFTVIGIVAAALSVIATIVLCGVLQKQAASPDGTAATGNTLHSLPFQRLF